MPIFEPGVQQVMDQVDALRHEVDDHWQIPREEALLLAQLVRIGRCVSICEIGTSYGYSTLHLAAATRGQGGRVHAFEISGRKIDAASQHLQQAGLSDCVVFHEGDARQTLRQIEPERPYDFVFIDAVKAQSRAYLDALRARLAPRAILVTDNTTTHASELADFVEHLRAQPDMRSCSVNVGNGFELTIRDAR